MLNSPRTRIGVLWLVCLGGFAAQASAATLVGHWTFDENAGTTAADSSGHNLHGTLEGPLTWTPGQFGSALHFDPAGADPPPEYVRIAHDSVLNFTTAFSISFWIKAAPQPSLASIIDKSHGGGDFTGWTIQAMSGDNLLVAVGTGSALPEGSGGQGAEGEPKGRDDAVLSI